RLEEVVRSAKHEREAVVGDTLGRELLAPFRVESRLYEQREHRREAGEQYRELEADGNERERRVVGFAVYVDVSVEDVRIELQTGCEREAREFSDERDQRQFRPADAHGFVEIVDGIGSEDVVDAEPFASQR